jgi:hypothetical protein
MPPFSTDQTRIRLNEWQESQAVVGINKFITDNSLTRSTYIVVGETERVANEDTKREYEAIWYQLYCFAVLREDYQSAALLNRELCPANPLPLKPETICEYMQFKYHWRHHPVCAYKTTTPIVYRTGPLPEDTAVLRAMGDWNAPHVVDKFRASLGYLHRLHPNLRIPYSPRCVECVSANVGIDSTTTHMYRSCVNHAGRPCLIEVGCATNSTEFLDEVLIAKKKMQGHVVRGAMSLLPCDIRDLRRALVGKDLQSFQIYLMVLLGIKLFLRADKLLSLRLEQFEKKAYVVDGNDVHGICLWIQGKKDVTKKYVYLWTDEQCPEFCPVRHLLVYLALTKITSGLLFPYVGKGKKKYDPTIHVNEWCYNKWLAMLKFLVSCHCRTKKGLPEDSLIKIGTHTLRKSAYVFAVFGIMKYNGFTVDDLTTSVETGTAHLQLANLLKSARHATLQNAMTYFEDASTLYEVVKHQNLPHLHKIGIWKSIHIQDIEKFQCVSVCSHLRKKDLPVLAEYYVLTKHGFPTDGTMEIAEVMEAVLAVPPTTDIVANLLNRFKSECNPALFQEFSTKLQEVIDAVEVRTRERTIENLNSIDDKVKEFMKNELANKDKECTNSSTGNDGERKRSAVTTAVPLVEDSTVPNSTKRKRGGNVSLVEYRTRYVGTKNTAERIRILYEVYTSLQRYSSPTGELDGASRTFYCKHVSKVVACINTCYNGDILQFTEEVCRTLGTKLFIGEKFKCTCGTQRTVVPS